MIVKILSDNEVYVEYKENKYCIKREYISGTMIENYFIYDYDMVDYYYTEFGTLEECLLYIQEK